MKWSFRIGMWALALASATFSHGAVQYWDGSAAAGLQHGDGAWSVAPGDAFWSAAAGGTPLGPWTNGNSATFSATNGFSTVSVSGALTAGVITVSGRSYLLTLSNGAALFTTNDPLIGSAAAMNDNGVIVKGGSGAPSAWNLGNRALTLGTASITTGNYAIVDGAGVPGSAAMTNLNGLYITGNGASLVLTNGGRLFGSSTFGDIRVGNNGAYDNNNRLVIAPGSLLDGGGTAPRFLICETGRGTNNAAIIDGGVLTNAGGVQVFGTNSGLVVKNGGAAFIKGSLTLNTASNYVTIDNALVSFAGAMTVGAWGQVTADNGSRLSTLSTESVIGNGAANPSCSVLLRGGSVWNVNNSGNIGIQMGSGGSASNTFLIDNSAVTNCGRFLIGDTAGRYNTLTITNNGKFIHAAAGGTRYIGVSAGALSNQVIIAGGAGVTSLWDLASVTLFLGTSTGSLLRVDGAGTPGSAVVTNCLAINVGNGAKASENVLVIVDGGMVHSAAASAIAGVTAAGASNNYALISGSGSAWNVGNQTLGIGMAGATNNSMTVTLGGLVTNLGVMTLAGSSNFLTVSDGGAVFLKGLLIGTAAGSLQDGLVVTGALSRLDLGGGALTLGNAAGTATGNVAVLTDGGTIDNIGVFTAFSNSSFTFAGGTFGTTSGVYSNGVFAVGNGGQPATLKILGGTFTSTGGLVVSGRALLKGFGAASGASEGLVLTNGATLSAGLSGAGGLGVAGSGLKWYGGATCLCEIVNLDQGPGSGWDVLNVATQLALIPDGRPLVIKVDSLGGLANFDAGRDYNLRIVSYGSMTGYDPTNFTLDLSAFAPGGAWSLTNAANSLWLVYRGGSSPAAADYTWNAPNTGFWTNGANWAGASAPPAGGSGTLAVAFGDTGVKYTASNTLAGTFQLNQLRFSSLSAVTNVLAGNAVALTNAGARVDYLAGETGGFIISNAVRLAADTEFGGSAIGGSVTMAGGLTSTGALMKTGGWDLLLPSTANLLDGALVVNSRDGRVIASTWAMLNGSGPVIISNGTLQVGGSGNFFANSKPNRLGKVVGAGAAWSNSYFAIAFKSTNVQMIVDGGKFYCADLQWFVTGSDNGLLVITNGGYILNGGNATYVGSGSTNCRFIVTGVNSWMYLNQYLCAGGSGGVSNTIVIEKGGMLRGSNNFGLWAASGTASRSNTVIIASGGTVYPSGLFVYGVSNSMTIRDAGSAVISQGAYLTSLGSGTGDFANVLTVADQGLVTNLYLQVALNGSWSNTLVVTNGGRMVEQANDAAIALGTNNTDRNRLIVTGSGSLWNMSARNLTVCQGTGALNRLVVEAGGLVTNIASLIVSAGSAAVNNGVTVDGGQLQATTVTFNNALANELKVTGAGWLSAVFLYATNLNNTIRFDGGTLNVKTVQVANGSAFVAGDGSQAASLVLTPGGRGIFADGFVLTNQAVFASSGIIQATSTVFGTLSPGSTGVGTVTNIGDLSFRAGSLIPLNLAGGSSPGAGWDWVVVTNGAVSLGGTLKPVLATGYVPSPAQRFLILTNMSGSVSGGFANAGNGQVVTLVGDDESPRAGAMTVEIGPQGVVLSGYRAWRPSGALILVR